MIFRLPACSFFRAVSAEYNYLRILLPLQSGVNLCIRLPDIKHNFGNIFVFIISRYIVVNTEFIRI